MKLGVLRGPDGSWGRVDTRPDSLRNFLTYSLHRLGVDYIDIYRPARLDPTVPIEGTVGAIAGLVQAGYVRHIGLSAIGADTLRRANAVHPIADLQIEYSLISRGIAARFCRPDANTAPGSPRTGCCRAACSATHFGAVKNSKPTTFERTARASRVRTWTGASSSSKRSPRSTGTTFLSRSSPSHGY